MEILELFTAVLALFIFPVYLGLVSRWHGGGFFPAPKLLIGLAWGLPFAFVTFEVWAAIDSAGTAANIALLVLLFSAYCKGTGHGGGIDRATSPEEPGAGRKMEKLERLIYWIGFKRWSRKTYDDALLAITGVFAVLPGVIAIAPFHPLCALAVAAGGALKAKAYHIGYHEQAEWEAAGVNMLDERTEIGEFMTGWFAGSTLSITHLIVGVLA